MRALVVYDSLYGNTARIAKAIGDALGGDTTVAEVTTIRAASLQGFDVVIVGSPTQGGRPTAVIRGWLGGIPADGFKGKEVVAFDTRSAAGEQGFALRMLMRLIGYAAPRIASALEARGGRLVVDPEGFIVLGKQGPLREGETERAAAWAAGVLIRAR